MRAGFSSRQTSAASGESEASDWCEVAEAMTAHFRKSKFTEGIVSAIQRAGTLFGEHFPRRTDDQDELSDGVERD